MAHRINFIGCGQLGRTLGLLWQREHTVTIGDILNRSLKSAEAAVSAIGAGHAIDDIAQMQAAKLTIVACGDDAIADCSQMLADSGVLRPGDVVFHCSGAQSSALLADCRQKGAFIASIHPIKSFANPQLAADSFAGTYCGVEGDAPALALAGPLFSELGANLLPILAEHKTLYHAASVIACNYLVALQELSILTFAKAGIEREQAMAVLKPIVSGTVENVFRLGTSEALTGPIARGDHQAVSNQLDTISAWNKNYGNLYRLLGDVSIPLAREQGHASDADLAQIKARLEKG